MLSMTSSPSFPISGITRLFHFFCLPTMTNLILDRLIYLCYRAAYSSANSKSNRAVHKAKSETEKVALQKNRSKIRRCISSGQANGTCQSNVMGEKRVKNAECLLSQRKRLGKSIMSVSSMSNSHGNSQWKTLLKAHVSQSHWR